MKPKAIGYLRRDISGRRQRRHELEIRALARRLGYDLARTLTLGPEVDAPVMRLRVLVDRLGAAAVITPHLEHLQAAEKQVLAVSDLITLDPERIWRHSPAAH
ncbi:hypothetical protein [Nocardia amamiensis]|uniref:hypothetical protein n=1 Tax=Nocardia amamiensis TaxID=404578 RepID=UPI000A9CFDEE|nr:hypothetical protein [Nocardia amamiensis]